MQELGKSGTRDVGAQFEASTEISTSGLRGGGREESLGLSYHQDFPSHMSGTTRGYRGGDKESFKQLFDLMTGNPHRLATQSMWPTDFCGLIAGPMLYSALQGHVASRHARYTTNRSGLSVTAVVHMDVRNLFLDHRKPHILQDNK